MSNTNDAAISSEQIDRYQTLFNARKDAKVVERAVSHQGILATSADFKADTDMTPVFSIDLDTGKVANQKQSGRCWMFAALNTMRHHLADLFKLTDFELSQNYTSFGISLKNQITSTKTCLTLLINP